MIKNIEFRYSGNFGRAARGSSALMRRCLDTLGAEMTAWIIAESREDTGEAKRETRYTIKGLSTKLQLSIIGGAPYSLYAQQYGRGAGKRPPPAVMLLWVQRKGLRASNSSARREAAKIQAVARRVPVKNTLSNNIKLGIRAAKAARIVKKLPQSKELRQQKAIAFVVGRAIGRRGIRGPRLFTRVLFVKRGAVNHAMAQYERGIKALIEGRAA